MMDGWKRLLSFIREWGLLTLTLASGAPSVVFALIFWSQGKEPPKIWQILFVCSLFSAWALGLRERKARLQAETPFKSCSGVRNMRLLGYDSHSITSPTF